MPPHAMERFVANAFRDLNRIDAYQWVAGGHEAVSYGEDLHEENAAYEETSFWFRQRNKVFLDLLRAFGAEEPLVDIGGGTGIVARHLNDNGFATINLEPTESGARLAVGRKVPTIVSTLEKAGVVPGSLPTVGMFDVLEHIEHDVAALSAVVDALKPGGLFFVTVPGHAWLWSSEDRLAGHFRRYTRLGLARRLRAVGLEPLYVTHIFTALTAPLFLLRTLPTLGGRIGQGVREDKRKLHVPPAFVSRTVDAIGDLERALLARRCRLPFGTSVLAVTRKLGS